MVGNDIIDLWEIRKHKRSMHPRFRAKILCPEEEDWVMRQAKPELAIWQLWACKEGAYKVYFQKTKHRFFGPRQFFCRIDGNLGLEKGLKVATPIGEFQAWLQSSTAYIHAICAEANGDLEETHWEILPMENRLPQKQSPVLREKVVNHLSQKWGAHPDSFHWEDDLGYPRLYQDGRLLQCSVSLSHHGGVGNIRDYFLICRSFHGISSNGNSVMNA